MPEPVMSKTLGPKSGYDLGGRLVWMLSRFNENLRSIANNGLGNLKF